MRAAEEFQKMEIELCPWEKSGRKEQKGLDFCNHRVKVRLRHDLWDQIGPIFPLKVKTYEWHVSRKVSITTMKSGNG